MLVKVQESPRGGRVLEVSVKFQLTHYEIVAAMLHAFQEGEKAVTRTICMQYAVNLLRDSGIEGLMGIYNKASVNDRLEVITLINGLFPEMVSAKHRPKLRIFGRR